MRNAQKGKLLEQVARNGLLHRRVLLTGGLALAGAAVGSSTAAAVAICARRASCAASPRQGPR